jgi:hypothetical protein
MHYCNHTRTFYHLVRPTETVPLSSRRAIASSVPLVPVLAVAAAAVAVVAAP